MHARQARTILKRFDKRILNQTSDCVGTAAIFKDGKWRLHIYIKQIKNSHRHLLKMRFANKARIAKAGEEPDENELETEILQVGKFIPYHYTARQRPAFGGISVGHYAITAGTLGCTVYRVIGGVLKKLILSNNHVLANANDCSIGDPILQPGPVCYPPPNDDCGEYPQDWFANLYDYVPIDFEGGVNYVDCAIAALREGTVWVNDQDVIAGDLRTGSTGTTYRCKLAHKTATANKPESGADWRTYWESMDCGDRIINIGLTGAAREVVGPDVVVKTGRTTEKTETTILGFSGEILIDYGAGVALFDDQLVTEMVNEADEYIAAPGDSGSLLVSKCSKEPLGLLFAGSEYFDIVLYNRATDVADALGISFMPARRLPRESGKITRKAGTQKICSQCCCVIPGPPVPPEGCLYCDVDDWANSFPYCKSNKCRGENSNPYKALQDHFSETGVNGPPPDYGLGTHWALSNETSIPQFLQVTVFGTGGCPCSGHVYSEGTSAQFMNGTYILEYWGNPGVNPCGPCAWIFSPNEVWTFYRVHFFYDPTDVNCNTEETTSIQYAGYPKIVVERDGNADEPFYDYAQDIVSCRVTWTENYEDSVPPGDANLFSGYAEAEDITNCISATIDNIKTCETGTAGGGTAIITPLEIPAPPESMNLNTRPIPPEKKNFCDSLKKGGYCPYCDKFVPRSWCERACKGLLGDEVITTKTTEVTEINKTEANSTPPPAAAGGGKKKGCCGGAARKLLNITKGYTGRAAQLLEDRMGLKILSVKSREMISAREKICEACDKLTWWSAGEYIEWLNSNKIKVVRNIADLSALPELEIYKRDDSRNKQFCSVCKCFLPAKWVVAEEICPPKDDHGNLLKKW